MGHAEVAQAPGQQGADGEQAVRGRAPGGRVVDVDQGQVARQRAGVVHHRLHAASLRHAEAQHHHQGHRHDNGLDQVGKAGRQEPAHDRVDDDDSGADEHGGNIVDAEQGGEQLSAGGEAGGQIGHEKDHDDHGGDGGEQVSLIPPALGEELGHRDGVDLVGVAADAPRHDEPVQIGAHSQSDGGPAGLRQAGEVGHAGQPHQQPGGHVAGLRTHGGDEGAQLPPPQIEVVYGVVAFGEPDAYAQHGDQIDRDGQADADLRNGHSISPHILLPSGSPTHKAGAGRPPAAHGVFLL